MGNYNTGADAGLIVVAVIVDLLIIAGVYVWTALSLNAVFRKVGEPDWAGWVPYFNTAVLLKLGGFSPWLIFLILVPVLGPLAVWVMLIIATYRINVAFGYREGGAIGMTVLAVVVLPVWSSILGWGSARWVGPDPRLRAAAIGAAPGAAFAPSYQQPAGAGYAPQPGAFAPAPPEYAPPAPRAGYEPPPAPSAAVPSTDAAPMDAASPTETRDAAGGLFASLYPTPADEDLEGVDDPVPVRRRSGVETETVADSPAPPVSASVIDAVPVAGAPVAAGPMRGAQRAPEPEPVPETEPEAERETERETEPVQPGDDDTATDGGRPAAAASADPWAPPAPVSAARRSPAPPEPADFSDTSAEVSAVAGAPMAGVPMSARSSVSARRGEPELPDAESAFDETIIAPRRRTEWMLTPPLGAPIRLTSPVLILGRRPSADPEYPDAQLIDIADETRTVSKTHARLELAADRWTITDLGSTNGVVLVADDGTETDLPAGASQLLGEKFLLGDAELRLTRGKD